MSDLQDISKYHPVQSCITTVSFPDKIEGVLAMIDKNSRLMEDDVMEMSTDLDHLLNFTPDMDIYWTAPRWLTEGDILFFYHAAAAKPRTKKFLRQARKCNKAYISHFVDYADKWAWDYSGTSAEGFDFKDLIRFLEHTHDLAIRYAGTIFGYAIVSAQSVFFKTESEQWHFKGKIFAPLGNVHIFAHPLEAENFTNFLLISRQAAITYIGKQQFDNIKKLVTTQPTKHPKRHENRLLYC